VSLYVTRLGGDHDRTRFDCGRPSLDDWFRHQASQADRKQGSARVFVLVDDEIEEGCLPLGYYAVCGHALLFEELPEDVRKGQPPHHPVAAVLLARLAIDGPLQRDPARRLGETLLADVVRQVIQANDHVATPLLVVDALDEQAASFYKRYGFVELPEKPLRLVARLKDIRKTFRLD
jgi:ribosomal protein S18 acetylase RimI-like enzyme